MIISSTVCFVDLVRGLLHHLAFFFFLSSSTRVIFGRKCLKKTKSCKALLVPEQQRNDLQSQVMAYSRTAGDLTCSNNITSCCKRLVPWIPLKSPPKAQIWQRKYWAESCWAAPHEDNLNTSHTATNPPTVRQWTWHGSSTKFPFLLMLVFSRSV